MVCIGLVVYHCAAHPISQGCLFMYKLVLSCTTSRVNARLSNENGAKSVFNSYVSSLCLVIVMSFIHVLPYLECAYSIGCDKT